MLVSDFDFHLPPELIAQDPSPQREQSRLLVVERATGRVRHAHAADLGAFLAPGDLLVVNDTRVIPARLHGHREPSGGRVECLLLRRLDADRWDALVHPGQKLRVGERMRLDGARPAQGHQPSPDTGSRRAGSGPGRGGATHEATAPALVAEVLERRTFGRRTIRLWREDHGDVDEAIDAIGEVPLPPYIKRTATEADRERYQTVYARVRGSVAAPTAGLHLTPSLLADLEARGIARTAITLHVGYGTFQPVRTPVVEDHRIDPEPYEIGDAAAATINAALDAGRRVIAVGTTTTRTLEAVARGSSGRIVPGAGFADLFIYPGHAFQVVGALLTNFHLPQSSLLMLVAAFAGRDLALEAYRIAVEQRYRFYSYGDAMLVL